MRNSYHSNYSISNSGDISAFSTGTVISIGKGMNGWRAVKGCLTFRLPFPFAYPALGDCLLILTRGNDCTRGHRSYLISGRSTISSNCGGTRIAGEGIIIVMTSFVGSSRLYSYRKSDDVYVNRISGSKVSRELTYVVERPITLFSLSDVVSTTNRFRYRNFAG